VLSEKTVTKISTSKLPSLLSDQEYERRLNRLIYCYINRWHSGAPWLLSETSDIRKIYEAVKQHGTCGYGEILDALDDMRQKPNGWRSLVSRLHHLTQIGWLEHAPPIKRKVKYPNGIYYTREFAQFRLAPGPTTGLMPGRIKKFLCKVSALDARRVTTNGIVARVNLTTAAALGEKNERNVDIIKRRLAGESLQQIGDAYGISRERVNQIFHRALTNTSEH
jgi:hypothetical protein